MSSTTWIAIGVIFFGVPGLFALLRMKSRGERKTNYGAVSDQWVAHHRADQTYDH